MNNQESYLYGILLADGNLSLNSRNRGKVVLELQLQDISLLEQLHNLYPESKLSNRTKDTNFKKNYTSVCWSNYQLSFRQWLIDCGFPVIEKTKNANLPIVDYSEVDFWRGFLDGDGSLGFKKDGTPFVSLVTASESIKDAYLDFLVIHYGLKKQSSRNKRDNVYNILIASEDAVQLVKDLWYDNCLSLDRKYQKAQQIKQWSRPQSLRKRSHPKRWTKEEDEYILSHSVKESISFLHRTKSSIKTRLWRLTK